jgi:hypothetical protein
MIFFDRANTILATKQANTNLTKIQLSDEIYEMHFLQFG